MSHAAMTPAKTTAMPLFETRQNPIFILGIVPRSGTNYLNNLLLAHPDVRSPGIVWEDYFLAHAEHLEGYVQRLQSAWNDKWVAQLQAALGADAVLRHLGDGLIRLMEEQYHHCVARGSQPSPPEDAPVTLVTATPNTHNLDYFFTLFPAAAPLLIVRDGRATVESGARSFGWDYEDAIRSWVSSGQRILAFCARPEHAGRHLLLRYETLYQDTHIEMRRVLEFLSLDCSRYDFGVCDTLGIMGSSELTQSVSGKLHWSYVDKSDGFNPLARAAHWSEPLRRRFLYLAGPTMAALGYDAADPELTPGDAWKRWNAALDVLYTMELKLRDRLPAAAAQLRRVRCRLLAAPSPNQPD